MKGPCRTAWILVGVLCLLSPAVAYAQSGTATSNVYSWMSATQVVSLTASSAAHGGLLTPASAALTTGLSSLYGIPPADRALPTPLLNMLLVGVPVDTSLPPNDLQDAANTTTGLGFGNSTGLQPSSSGRGMGSTGMHRSASGAHKGSQSGRRGGGGGGGHGGGGHGAKAAHHPSQPGRGATGTGGANSGHPVPAKH